MHKKFSEHKFPTCIFAAPNHRKQIERGVFSLSSYQMAIQRGVRVVEGARLESVYTGDCIEGSNPFLSAERDHSLVNGLFSF